MNPQSEELFVAVLQKQANEVKRLLEAGADSNTRNRVGETALHHASSLGDKKTAKGLLRAKANLTIKDHRGRTAIDAAVEAKQLPLAEYLRCCGRVLFVIILSCRSR